MNDTIRVTVPTCASSTANSLATTTPSSVAPAIHGVRHWRRFAYTIVANAIDDHSSDSTAWTSVDRHNACGVYGTSNQKWTVRSAIALIHRNTSAQNTTAIVPFGNASKMPGSS